jgi:hypothetical protein
MGVGISGFYWTNNSAAPALVAWSGATDIPNLYDAARIMSVEFLFSWSNNTSTANATPGYNMLPYMYIARDYDDINTVSGTV